MKENYNISANEGEKLTRAFIQRRMEELGFDGIIFADGAQTDIALLNPANPVQ